VTPIFKKKMPKRSKKRVKKVKPVKRQNRQNREKKQKGKTKMNTLYATKKYILSKLSKRKSENKNRVHKSACNNSNDKKEQQIDLTVSDLLKKRQKEIKFDKKFLGFRTGEDIIFKGVTTILKNKFSCFDAQGVMMEYKKKQTTCKINKKSKEESESKKVGKPTYMSSNKEEKIIDYDYCKNMGDIEHGNRLDSDIYNYIKSGGKIEAVGKHVCAKKLIVYLHKIGWIPWGVQVAICDPKLMIATACDLICIDKNGEIKLIEIKATKYSDDYYYEHCCPIDEQYIKYNGGVLTLKNTLHNHHQLQLGLTHYILTKNYISHSNVSAYIIRVTKGSICKYPLIDFLQKKENMNKIINVVKN
jgi:hypothetical protein